MAVSTVEDTGNGATFSLGTTSFAVRIKKINGIEVKIDKLEVSNLSTTNWKKFIASDLLDTPELTCEFYWDTTKAVAFTGGSKLLGNTPETGTLTYPLRANGGEATAANLAGTGFISSIKFPDLENGSVQMGSFTFTFDGTTGPAFTVAS